MQESQEGVQGGGCTCLPMLQETEWTRALKSMGRRSRLCRHPRPRAPRENASLQLKGTGFQSSDKHLSGENAVEYRNRCPQCSHNIPVDDPLKPPASPLSPFPKMAWPPTS